VDQVVKLRWQYGVDGAWRALGTGGRTYVVEPNAQGFQRCRALAARATVGAASDPPARRGLDRDAMSVVVRATSRWLPVRNKVGGTV
jgi:hypothetical protein